MKWTGFYMFYATFVDGDVRYLNISHSMFQIDVCIWPLCVTMGPTMGRMHETSLA